ncbi:MAG: cytochrome c oxidase subunit II [Actinobacteria bacterium]|nr:cytochrome c oxidase subunit II [Actinomycetota bacterium]
MLLAFAGPAMAGVVTPESGGSPNADDISVLYKITLYIAIVIFLIVEGTLIWALVKFRVRRGGRAEQIRGNTPLEVGWTIGAALILVLLATVTFIYLDDIKNPAPSGPDGLAAKPVQVASIDQPEPPGGKALNIDVNGQQYLWRYDYPGTQPLFSYYEMVVPTDTTVTLDIRSSDVAHSWWVPKLGGKADAVPGHTNHTWFKISKPGIYKGQCAELCGFGHADMHAVVRAVPPDEFQNWERQQHANLLDSQKQLSSQRRAREAAGEAGG